MRTIRSFTFLLVIGLFVLACSGSAQGILSTTGDAIPDNGGEQSGGGDPKPAPAAGEPTVDGFGGGQVAAIDDAKIIRTGTMSLDVSDVSAAVRSARDAIVGLGGYVGASSTSNEGDRPTAAITYRIPVVRWEAALDALRSLDGLTTEVVNEQTDAVEVTSQIVDLDARIANLRASETALQAIAAQATRISDILEVQARLTETRGQIESLAAQQKDLTDRAAFSALTVRFNVPFVAVDVATNAWDPSAIVDSAVATTVSVVQGVATAGIWLVIVMLPIVIALLFVILIVGTIVRRFDSRRRATDDRPPVEPLAGEG
jgi:hypothetical protein